MTLLMSRFWYCSVPPVTKVVIKELNTAIVDIVCDGKAHLVAYCTIANRVTAGGLNLPHIESRINAYRL